MGYKGISKTILAVLLTTLCSLAVFTTVNDYQVTTVEAATKSQTKKTSKKTSKKKSKIATPKTVKDDKHMIGLKKFSYKTSSEKKDYPDLLAHPKAWIDVDIATQRVYIKDGNKNLYEMYSSTGKHDTTPRGTYYIQSEKGDYFYTEPLKLGAYYWVSFLNHGEYLFHTTPTDENGKYVLSISKTLGREPSSHGCVHLSTPDCKWVYENVPSGMKVVIHGKYQS